MFCTYCAIKCMLDQTLNLGCLFDDDDSENLQVEKVEKYFQLAYQLRKYQGFDDADEGVHFSVDRTKNEDDFKKLVDLSKSNYCDIHKYNLKDVDVDVDVNVDVDVEKIKI